MSEAKDNVTPDQPITPRIEKSNFRTCDNENSRYPLLVTLLPDLHITYKPLKVPLALGQGNKGAFYRLWILLIIVPSSS